MQIRRSIYSFGILLMLLFCNSSCSEKFEPTPLTVTELIAGKEKKAWKINGIEAIDEGEVDGPYSAAELFAPCDMDNEIIFFNNIERTYHFTGGAIKCDNAEPDELIEHVWSYTTVNSTLEFALPFEFFGAIYILPYTVKKLTASEMVLEVYFDNVFQDGTNASYRINLRSTDY